jgi:hypothetical protein
MQDMQDRTFGMHENLASDIHDFSYMKGTLPDLMGGYLRVGCAYSLYMHRDQVLKSSEARRAWAGHPCDRCQTILSDSVPTEKSFFLPHKPSLASTNASCGGARIKARKRDKQDQAHMT